MMNVGVGTARQKYCRCATLPCLTQGAIAAGFQNLGGGNSAVQNWAATREHKFVRVSPIFCQLAHWLVTQRNRTLDSIRRRSNFLTNVVGLGWGQ